MPASRVIRRFPDHDGKFSRQSAALFQAIGAYDTTFTQSAPATSTTPLA
jgi:hypothetical protein